MTSSELGAGQPRRRRAARPVEDTETTPPAEVDVPPAAPGSPPPAVETPERRPLLVATGLVRTFRISARPNRAVDDVSLTVGAGELVAIMGPSGCGKSTLLHMLAGLDRPDAGSIVIEGRNLGTMNERELTLYRREKIGFVFQFFNLIPNLTAAENIALPLRIAGKHADGGTLSGLMKALSLNNLQGHRPEEISGGEQQRVAIARALIVQPAILMADEPTGNLDFTTGREVLKFIKSTCKDSGQTVILVTHDARAAAYADRVLVMRDGKIVDEVIMGQEQNDVSTLVPRLAKLGL